MTIRRRPASTAHALHQERVERGQVDRGQVDPAQRATWRMPPLAELSRPTLSTGTRLGLTVLRGYLIIAVGLVVVRIVQLALGH
jgi:hypothetical protein